jgi:general secretion pathway protein A
LLITGDVGTGKTTLINALVDSFEPKEVVYAIVTDPELNRLDFFNIIAHAFRIPKKFHSKADFLIYFSKFLHFQAKKDRKTVLIIDESQRLSQALLEEIRLLSNIERNGHKLLNIFFLGQNEFLYLLEKNENRALKQRITLRYHLEPLTREETAAYIQHRLRVAGSKTSPFTPAAVESIYAFSKGYPRLINIICDHALLSGYVEEAAAVDTTIIDECWKELAFTPAAPPPMEQTSQEGISPTGQDTTTKGRQSAYPFFVVALLAALLTASAVLIYSVYSDPARSILQEVRQLQTSIQRLEEKTTPPQPAPSSEIATAPAAEAASPVAQSQIEKKTAAPDPPNHSLSGPENPLPPSAPMEAETDTAALQDRLDRFLAETGNPFSVYFVYNSNALTESDYELLDRFAGRVLPVSDARIVIAGHTDSSGSSTYNQTLSEFRADTVKSYLVGKGIAASRIETLGRGESGADEGLQSSEPAKAKRRVEIRVVMGEEGQRVRR